MTTVSDGLYQYGGMPVGPGDLVTGKLFTATQVPQPVGRAWFVNTSQGTNGGGKTPNTAFTTMAAAFNSIRSGDIIYFVGDVREQLVTPVNVFDVTVVGCGNVPRNADATPTGGNYAASTWRAPVSPVAAQATVRVLQQGWRFVNILFNMADVNSAGVEIVRNAAAGDDERDASHASILGCRFAGAGIGIRSGVAGSFTENTTNVRVVGNTFLSNTTAISQTAGFGGLNWQIMQNQFITCTNDIVGPFSACKIIGNSMSLAPTASIVLTGGADNMVQGNFLSGTYADGALYAPGTNDNWNGNAASTGFTAAVPS